MKNLLVMIALVTSMVVPAYGQDTLVTASDLRAEIVTVNGTIAALEVRLVKWMVGIVLTVAGLQTAAMVAVVGGLDLPVAIWRHNKRHNKRRSLRL